MYQCKREEIRPAIQGPKNQEQKNTRRKFEGQKSRDQKPSANNQKLRMPRTRSQVRSQVSSPSVATKRRAHNPTRQFQAKSQVPQPNLKHHYRMPSSWRQASSITTSVCRFAPIIKQKATSPSPFCPPNYQRKDHKVPLSSLPLKAPHKLNQAAHADS